MLDWLRKLLFVENYISPEERAIEVLERCIAQEKEEKRQLLDLIIQMQNPNKAEPNQTQHKEFKPISTFTPWRVKQQMLEKEDAEKHRLMKAAEKEQEEIDKMKKELEKTDDLEKALGITDATESGSK